jgi:hypothetical protein
VRSWSGWQVLLTGHLDELAYTLGAVDQSLPFPALRALSRINERAQTADRDPAFSRRIREAAEQEQQRKAQAMPERVPPRW